jgi:CDP-paratose 2-epimerase
MPTCCLRGGCLTGPNHSGVELHGFLSYLIKCNVQEIEYKIYGYKGKQVRDNIHSFDVAHFIDLFIQNPKVAAVYNIGGGRENSISIIEAFKLIESISNKQMKYSYLEENRIGDHICYISDLSKIKEDFPNWGITKNLKITFQEIHDSWSAKELK